MNLEELEAAAKDMNEIKKTKYFALVDHLRGVMNEFISNNLYGIARIQHVNESSMQIEIISKDNRKYGHTFDIYYHTPYSKESRKLELNFGCFGSFNCNGTDEINYCIALGKIASNMKDFEKKLILSDEAKKFFDEYAEASNEYYKINDKIRNFKFEQKKIEDDKKREEFAAKLIVGAKINVGKKYISGDPCIYEIEHMTAKNILFKQNYGKRTKKEDVIHNLMSGQWKLV